MTSNERRIIPGWKNDPRRKPAARTAVRSQRLSSPIYPVVVRVVRASLKARLAKRIGTSVPHAMRPVGKAGVYAVGVRVMVGCLVAVYNFRFLTFNSKHPSSNSRQQFFNIATVAQTQQDAECGFRCGELEFSAPSTMFLILGYRHSRIGPHASSLLISRAEVGPQENSRT
jgi:hypothetical protein